jgi:hypothetical protein
MSLSLFLPVNPGAVVRVLSSPIGCVMGAPFASLEASAGPVLWRPTLAASHDPRVPLPRVQFIRDGGWRRTVSGAGRSSHRHAAAGLRESCRTRTVCSR